MNTYESKNKAKTITAIVAVVVIIGVVVLIEALQNKSNNASTTASTDPSSAQVTSPSDTSSTPAASDSGATYKDGTYTADSQYYVPHGYEDIKVTLTVANGVVTNSSIVNSESDHDSARYQQDFESAYKTKVVGKSLSDLKLSYIAGASDTTDGFNNALSQIRSQAKA